MSKLRDALRKKYRTPREAIAALGLDEEILAERAYDSVNPQLKEKNMKVKLSPLGTVAYGALMTFLKPQLAMDSEIDLKRVLRNVNAKNFKGKRPMVTASINALVKDKLDPQYAQDGALNSDGLDAVLDMIEIAADEFPEEFKEKMEEKKEEKGKDKKPKAGARDEEMEGDDDEPAEDAESDEDDETAEERQERLKKRADAKAAKDKKAKDAKKARDAKVEEKSDTDETEEEIGEDEDDDEEEKERAMDARVELAVEARMKKERQRLEDIVTAKEHVSSKVGNLNGIAFDSAAAVYRRALVVATGKEPPKKADAESLRYAFDNLPQKDSSRRNVIAMDGSSTPASSSIAKRSPTLASNLARIGRA